jgi:putative aminopeptidase FrvX
LSRLPDVDATIATLRSIASAPTAPYHEAHALAAILEEVLRAGIHVRIDAYGQLFARVQHGSAHPIALIAHTDHPAFEIVSATGSEGVVRILGGFRGGTSGEIRVRVYDDRGHGPVAAVLDRFVPDLDPVHNSAGRMRIRAQAPLAAGQWAVLDLPPFEVRGQQLHLAAADDLAGCAVIVLALEELARATFPVNMTGVFTRAEETGLYGARLIVEEHALPRDAVVISVEASRALPHAPSGGGVVVRAGDLNNTFTNDAERFLRAAAERLRRDGVRTQRALLDGGTCEGSTFVVNGWTTTAIALPNVNYHNRTDDDGFAPEVVHVDDARSAVALLVETARAVAEDLRESWWADTGPVPPQIKDVLRPE